VPELPEVETTRRGIEPHIQGRTVTGLVVRESRLRWPVPDDLALLVVGGTVRAVERRAKYLLLRIGAGGLIVHLGMSGSLRIASPESPIRKHDHVDLWFGDLGLRYHDPRRFGCLLWMADDPLKHPLLADLGPEPFDPAFSGDYLHALAHARGTPVKCFIMEGAVVVGVGNIYAAEALFRAGIHPGRAARTLGRKRWHLLAKAIRDVLTEAIAQGGTTLRDFVNEAGRPGYFQQTLRVYGREGEPCKRCGIAIRQLKLGQRASFFCPRCQR